MKTIKKAIHAFYTFAVNNGIYMIKSLFFTFYFLFLFYPLINASSSIQQPIEPHLFKLTTPQKKRHKKVAYSLGGIILEQAFNQLLKNAGLPQQKISPKEIFAYAQSANKKNRYAQLTIEEEIAQEVINQGVNYLTAAIVKKARLIPSTIVPTFVFGSIIENNKAFLMPKLHAKMSALMQKNHKNIMIHCSTQGDQRALIGATGYFLATKSRELESRLTNCPYALGIDIGGTNIRVALVNIPHLNLASDIIKTPSLQTDNELATMQLINAYLHKKIWSRHRMIFHGPQLHDHSRVSTHWSTALMENPIQQKHVSLCESFLKNLYLVIEQFDLTRVAFIGISIAGTVSNDSTVKLSYNLPLTGINLGVKIRNKFQKPTFLANDILCAGLGEALTGKAKGLDEFIIVGIGTGIGIQIIKPQTLLRTP